MAEEEISELEDISIESSKTEAKRTKTERKKEQNIQGLWDNYKRCNVCEMGLSEERKRTKKYLRI